MKRIGRFHLPTSDILFTKHCINKEHTPYGHNFQTKYIAKIVKLSETTGNVIDAGANVGLFAVAFAKNFNKVFAFEPVPLNNECLVRNVHGYDNIELYDCALGSKSGEVEMIGRLNNTGTFKIADKPKPRKGNEICTNIPVKPLDDFRFKNISCIKIDCEGYEADVLDGARNTIRKYKPLLCIEFMPIDKGGDQSVHDRTNKILKIHGYKMIWQGHNDAIFSC